MDLFKQFGVDPTKEAEVWRAIPHSADYHFNGALQDTDEIRLDTNRRSVLWTGKPLWRSTKSDDTKYFLKALCRISCQNNSAPYRKVNCNSLDTNII